MPNKTASLTLPDNTWVTFGVQVLTASDISDDKQQDEI